jgi:hypothetical protein
MMSGDPEEVYMMPELPENVLQLVLLLIPVIVLQAALMLVALVDLVRRERTRGPKWVWAAVIVLVNLFGPIIYLVAGREE